MPTKTGISRKPPMMISSIPPFMAICENIAVHNAATQPIIRQVLFLAKAKISKAATQGMRRKIPPAYSKITMISQYLLHSSVDINNMLYISFKQISALIKRKEKAGQVSPADFSYLLNFKLTPTPTRDARCGRGAWWERAFRRLWPFGRLPALPLSPQSDACTRASRYRPG